MQELQLLSEKISRLVKRFNVLKAENVQLKETLSQQTNVVETMKQKCIVLEQEITAGLLSKALEGNENAVEVRKQLDAVISSIDKILGALDE